MGEAGTLSIAVRVGSVVGVDAGVESDVSVIIPAKVAVGLVCASGSEGIGAWLTGILPARTWQALVAKARMRTSCRIRLLVFAFIGQFPSPAIISEVVAIPTQPERKTQLVGYNCAPKGN